MSEPIDNHPSGPPWHVRLAMTLVAWLVAFGLVITLLSGFGKQLGSLPLALRALVISGVLVTVMTTAVMPALSLAARRWQAGRARKRPRAPERLTGSDTESREDRSAQVGPTGV